MSGYGDYKILSTKDNYKGVYYGPTKETVFCFIRPIIHRGGKLEIERVWKPIELIGEGDSPRNR